MSSVTEVLEMALLDLVWGADAYTPAADLYVGLSTTAINNDGTGITEPDALDGYARVQVTNDLTEWPAAASGGPATKQNANEIAFPTASGTWGQVTHFFFATDGSSVLPADIIAFGALDVPRTIEENDTASFAAGAITITLD